jgi:hypothetical protein
LRKPRRGLIACDVSARGEALVRNVIGSLEGRPARQGPAPSELGQGRTAAEAAGKAPCVAVLADGVALEAFDKGEADLLAVLPEMNGIDDPIGRRKLEGRSELSWLPDAVRRLDRSGSNLEGDRWLKDLRRARCRGNLPSR